MDIPIFSEHKPVTSMRMKLLGILALIISYPLNCLSPLAIERILRRLSKRLKPSSKTQAINARNAICAVSKRCRSQKGCIKRSLAVFILLWMQRRAVSWCTGFVINPFRAHAWVELYGMPIGEIGEIEDFKKTICVPIFEQGESSDE